MPEHVEQRDLVVGEALLAEVVVVRQARPAEPAQVRAQQPELARQLPDHRAPAPPVLRPAVQGEHGRGVRRSGGGEVHPHAGRQVVEAVLDTVELGHGRRHEGTRYAAGCELVLLVAPRTRLIAAPASARTRADGAPGAGRPGRRPTSTPSAPPRRPQPRLVHAARARDDRGLLPRPRHPGAALLEFVVSRPGPEMTVDRETRERDRRGRAARGAQLPPDGDRPREPLAAHQDLHDRPLRATSSSSTSGSSR